MNCEASFCRDDTRLYLKGGSLPSSPSEDYPGWNDSRRMCGLFQVIAENSNSVFWARDLEADKLLYINPAYERVWGRPRQELLRLNDSWLDAVHPADAALVRAGHAERGSEKKIVECRIVRGDGVIRWLRSQIFVVQDGQGRGYEVGIAEDVTDFRMLLERQRDAEKCSRRLIEEEQKRIARDLHDQFGQLLPLLGQRIERLCRGWQQTVMVAAAGDSRERLGELVESNALTRALVDRLLNNLGGIIRRTINRLRPECLEDLGFLPGIKFKVREFVKSHPGIKTSFAVVGQSRSIGREQEEELYWVLQEALVNIARHAGADRVTVRLIFAWPEVVLEIKDNGRGFEREVLGRGPTSQGGLGLYGMRERLAGIGGELRILPEVGRGTRIRAKLIVADV